MQRTKDKLPLDSLLLRHPPSPTPRLRAPTPPPKQAQHGFARNRVWEVAEAGEDSCTLTLAADEFTLALWPHDFRLEMRVGLCRVLLRLRLRRRRRRRRRRLAGSDASAAALRG